jgi:hypothetical protein
LTKDAEPEAGSSEMLGSGRASGWTLRFASRLFAVGDEARGMSALLSTAEAEGKTVPGAAMGARWVGLLAAKSFEFVEFACVELEAVAVADDWRIALSTDKVCGKELEAFADD